VLALPVDEGLAVIASNYGQEHNPGWYYNLRANPEGEVDVDGERWAFRAVEVDDERRELVANSVVVANCRYFGGGMKITPDADPADGLLDVLVIADINPLDLAFNLPRLYRGTHLPHPKLELLRGRSARVEPAAGERPYLVEADGEQPGSAPASFDVLPRALALRTPD
jgi:deazaflavin-dependent oxidoreductase (nitroreductase family)